MVPIIEKDCILPLGYSIFYKEYNLIRFNHQKTLLNSGLVVEVVPCTPLGLASTHELFVRIVFL